MEHANGTAIDISLEALANNPQAFAGLTAHEFFHLWNVKRIRPQSLEPIDYTKENYTRASVVQRRHDHHGGEHHPAARRPAG